MKRFSFFALRPCTVSSPTLPRPPFCFVSSPSDFPRYHPANLTTLTFSPFFPCCVSICLRPRLFLFFLLLPSFPFLPPSPFPSRLCCTTLPSSSTSLASHLSPLAFCLSPLACRLRPPRLSLLLGILQSSLALSLTDNPPVFHTHVSFSFLQRFAHPVSSSKRRYHKWLDIGDRQYEERERERKRMREGTSISPSCL